jgi:S1-C subfamily serine protease
LKILVKNYIIIIEVIAMKSLIRLKVILSLMLLIAGCNNLNTNAIDKALSLRDQGSYFEALTVLNSETDEKAIEIEGFSDLFSELVSIQGARIYKYFYNVTSISDLEFIYPQLKQFISIIDEKETLTYINDLVDLLWLNKKYEVAEIFIENFIKRENLTNFEQLRSRNNLFLKNSFKSGSEVAKYLQNKLVSIKTFDVNGVQISTGSGFFINSNGLIVTNYHVVEYAGRIEITQASGTKNEARLLIHDSNRDLAILSSTIRGAEYVQLGNSYLVETGDKIYTYGSPLGISSTISDGVVSKNISIINGKEYIQISAPISPGSSGGMLVDERGFVIGITTSSLIYGQNLNLAIPINRAINLINNIDPSIKIEEYAPNYFVELTKSTINQINFYSYSNNNSVKKFLFLDENKEAVYGIIETASSYYEGEMNGEGNYHGLGVFSDINGTFYGNFINNQRQGKGMFVYNNGDVFKGYYIDGLWNGSGSFYWGFENDSLFGHYYSGQFINGNRTGTGLYFWPNGDIYEGNFVNGVSTGKGEIYWTNGSYYIGDFVNDVRTGKGEYYWTDGSYYIGDFVNDVRTGKGEIYWTNGNAYVGGFLENELHGFGIHTWQNGVKHEGNFFNGRPFANGVRTFIGGDTFNANWTGWCDGTGIYRFNSSGRTQNNTLRNCNWD